MPCIFLLHWTEYSLVCLFYVSLVYYDFYANALYFATETAKKYSWELAAHLDGDKGEQGADAVDGGAQQDWPLRTQLPAPGNGFRLSKNLWNKLNNVAFLYRNQTIYFRFKSSRTTFQWIRILLFLLKRLFPDIIEAIHCSTYKLTLSEMQ